MGSLCRNRGSKHAIHRLLLLLLPCVSFWGASGVLAAAANSETQPVSEVVFRIETTNSHGRAWYEASFNEGIWDPDEQVYSWTVSGIDLVNDATQDWIGTLTDASLYISIGQAGEIELNIGFISGPEVTDVRVMSPLVKFLDEIPGSFARARAIASVTLTDAGGDGAYLIGAGVEGTGVFRSYYNGFLTEGERFSHLVGYIATDGGGTVTASQYDPAVGFREIGESVRDISSEIAFSVSPMDMAFAFTTTGYPHAPPCPGDLNDDGSVGAEDLAAFLASYGACSGDPLYRADADFNENGCIEADDLSYFLSVYGVQCW